ncbi:MAG: hypothetical protein LBF15_06240 [Candidatus Peribacteria bacterium]|jgi:hypothetical protein|nr:hypothetical protein [Candidatus Peribacteria bacterium]
MTSCGKGKGNNSNNGRSNTNNSVFSSEDKLATSYSKYIEAKSKMIESITNSESLSGNFGISMSILGLTLIDAMALPATVCGLGESATTGLAFMFSGISYKEEGNKCIFTYKTNEGKKTIKLTAEYDAKTDSARMESYEEDKLGLVSEYIKIGKGYASQYYSINEDGIIEVYKVFFTDKDIATGIFGDVDSVPDSIYKNASGLDFGWTKSDDFWVQIKDGKTTSIIDGEQVNY